MFPSVDSPLDIPPIPSFVYSDPPNSVDAVATVWCPAIFLVEATAAYIAVKQPQVSFLKAKILQAQTSSGYKRCTNSKTPVSRVHIKSRQLSGVLKIGVARGTGSREPDNSAIVDLNNCVRLRGISTGKIIFQHPVFRSQPFEILIRKYAAVCHLPRSYVDRGNVKRIVRSGVSDLHTAIMTCT